jgi:hypothetical protein
MGNCREVSYGMLSEMLSGSVVLDIVGKAERRLPQLQSFQIRLFGDFSPNPGPGMTLHTLIPTQGTVKETSCRGSFVKPAKKPLNK